MVRCEFFLVANFCQWQHIPICLPKEIVQTYVILGKIFLSREKKAEDIDAFLYISRAEKNPGDRHPRHLMRLYFNMKNICASNFVMKNKFSIRRCRFRSGHTRSVYREQVRPCSNWLSGFDGIGRIF